MNILNGKLKVSAWEHNLKKLVSQFKRDNRHFKDYNYIRSKTFVILDEEYDENDKQKKVANLQRCVSERRLLMSKSIKEKKMKKMMKIKEFDDN